MEIAKADALLVKRVNIRRLNPRITGAAQIGITLIVGQDKNDIRLFTHNGLVKRET